MGYENSTGATFHFKMLSKEETLKSRHPQVVDLSIFKVSRNEEIRVSEKIYRIQLPSIGSLFGIGALQGFLRNTPVDPGRWRSYLVGT